MNFRLYELLLESYVLLLFIAATYRTEVRREEVFFWKNDYTKKFSGNLENRGLFS